MTLFALQYAMPDVNLALILPELIVCIVGVVVMLVDAFAKPSQRWITGGISMAGVIASAIRSGGFWVNLGGPKQGVKWGLRLDRVGSRISLHVSRFLPTHIP